MAKGIPANVLKLLTEADKRNGFPVGTMQSIMQQETGGNLKYLADPTAYHYAADGNGKRVAQHTGKVSTAFGPFGILESTGAKPGYGVAPLKNKSLEEQVRFASEYLAGRSKQAGSLQAGLAGYGEGKKYAQQVVNRVNGKPTTILDLPDDQVPQLSDLQIAQAAAAPVTQVAVAPQAQAQAAPVMLADASMAPGVGAPVAMAPVAAPVNPVAALSRLLPPQQMRPADLNYGNQLAENAVPESTPVFEGEEDNSQMVAQMMKRFGLGRYSQDMERYQASVPEFTRPA